MKKINLSIMLVLFWTAFLHSQQFVYKPVNPAFGGDTFNYQWLLSSAQTQNQFKATSSGTDLNSLNSLDSFMQSLNRQLLSQLSSKLVGNQLGDGPLKPGTYIFGTMYMQVTQTDQGLTISILNTSTGEQSTINIPN